VNKNRNQTIKIRNFSKQLRLGEILYKLYHSPKGLIERCHNRGFFNYFIDYKERKKMEAAVSSIPIIKKNTSESPLKIYFLTGRKFWYQTCFCLYSLIKHSNESFIPVIYNDGTLQEKHFKV